jgi:hypothetical protein
MHRPAMAGVVLLALASGLVAEGESSLLDSNIEITEAQLAFQAVAAENNDLRQRLDEAQEGIKSLTVSLAAANGEAEVFRRESVELRLRMEALGVDGLSADREKLEQRLLKAVRDLQLLQSEKEKLSDQLLELSEAALRYAKSASSEDAEARLSLEVAMRNMSEVLGLPSNNELSQPSSAEPADITEGSVISIKDELALVVINIGNRQGVNVGMPFKVFRAEQEIGLLRVVDVREKISGSVIQSLSSEKNKIKVGDRLRVDAK